jgi:hypothetical protein
VALSLIGIIIAPTALFQLSSLYPMNARHMAAAPARGVDSRVSALVDAKTLKAELVLGPLGSYGHVSAAGFPVSSNLNYL